MKMNVEQSCIPDELNRLQTILVNSDVTTINVTIRRQNGTVISGQLASWDHSGHVSILAPESRVYYIPVNSIVALHHDFCRNVSDENLDYDLDEAHRETSFIEHSAAA